MTNAYMESGRLLSFNWSWDKDLWVFYQQLFANTDERIHVISTKKEKRERIMQRTANVLG